MGAMASRFALGAMLLQSDKADVTAHSAIRGLSLIRRLGTSALGYENDN
jgi:hypothetical protein